MSLDVYLLTPTVCPHCGHKICEASETLYTANITHNLTKMALQTDDECLYKALWHPELIVNDGKAVLAKQLIPGLEKGLAELIADPSRFQLHNAANGWGSYDNLLEFTRNYLDACNRHSSATVEVSR